jgi:hypothetical protein
MQACKAMAQRSLPSVSMWRASHGTTVAAKQAA